MKYLSAVISVVLGITMSSIASAEQTVSTPKTDSAKQSESIWEGVTFNEDREILDYDLTVLDGIEDKLIKRTRVLTGIEYEEYVYADAPSQVFESLILADGSTKFTDTFRLAYVLKHVQQSIGKDKYELADKSLGYEIMPRYEKWVNPGFNYAIELAVKGLDSPDEGEHCFYKDPVNKPGGNCYAVPSWQRWEITPEGNFSSGNHLLHLNLTLGHIVSDGNMFETEPLYLYTVNDKVRLGLKPFWNKQYTDFGWEEYNIKPLIQFTDLPGDIYLELRYEKGQTRFNDGASPGGRSGYDYNNYALYTEIPINDTITILGDFAYRKHEQWNGNQYSWGDKEGVFAKVGLIWYF